jgi:hypothetical protein
MNAVTVTILRDPESPRWWLAKFTLGDQSYTTQGAIVDDARYMAADLLTLLGAGADTDVMYVLDDHETLAEVLARPVTPSLLSEPATGGIATRS